MLCLFCWVFCFISSLDQSCLFAATYIEGCFQSILLRNLENNSTLLCFVHCVYCVFPSLPFSLCGAFDGLSIFLLYSAICTPSHQFPQFSLYSHTHLDTLTPYNNLSNNLSSSGGILGSQTYNNFQCIHRISAK